jgi:hypothetical protein
VIPHSQNHSGLRRTPRSNVCLSALLPFFVAARIEFARFTEGHMRWRDSLRFPLAADNSNRDTAGALPLRRGGG